MKKIFSLFILSLCFVTAGAQESFWGEMELAYQKAKQLIGDKGDDFDYYIGETQRAISVSPGLFQKLTKVWLVFVDEEPGSGWEHPCKYVYLPKNNNQLYYEIITSVRDKKLYKSL